MFERDDSLGYRHFLAHWRKVGSCLIVRFMCSAHTCGPPRSDLVQRPELSHAGPAMSTVNAELSRPTGVGCSDRLGSDLLVTMSSRKKYRRANHNYSETTLDQGNSSLKG